MKLFFFISIIIILAVDLFSENSENRIEWEEVEGANQYSVQIRKEDTSPVLEEKTSALFFKARIEEPGNYEYRIGAENKIGNIVWSEWKSLTVRKKPPLSERKILLAWEKMPEAVSYSLVIVDSAEKTVYEDFLTSSEISLNLPEGKYRYRVSAINQLGSSASSEWHTFEVRKKELSKKPESADSLRWEVIRRSAVLPGWGQHHRKDSLYRVFSYPVSFSLLASLYHLNYKKNADAQKQYDNGISILALIQNSNSNSAKAAGIYTYLSTASARNSLDDTFTSGNQILLLLSGLYLLNILDAAFFYDYSKPVSFFQEPKWQIQTARKSINKFQTETYCEIFYRTNL